VEKGRKAVEKEPFSTITLTKKMELEAELL
jgi:hypothetical protein